VLNYYFDGTEVASFFGGAQGAEPLNYLQIYSEDIQYAEANVNAPGAGGRDRRRHHRHLGAGSAQPGESESPGDR